MCQAVYQALCVHLPISFSPQCAEVVCDDPSCLTDKKQKSLYNFVNILNPTKLYTLNGWIFWCVNTISPPGHKVAGTGVLCVTDSLRAWGRERTWDGQALWEVTSSSGLQLLGSPESVLTGWSGEGWYERE